VPPDWLFFVRNTTLFAQTFDPATGALSGDPIQLAGDVFVSPPGRAGFSVSDNGVLVYRSGSPPPPSELVWHDRQGKRVGAVGERGFFTNPALSPDGRYLAVGRSVTPIDYRDIWVIDLVRGSTSRFTFDAGDDLNPVWSPDGSRIAFTSTRNGQRDIYVKSATGAGAETVLFADNTSKSLEDWSPDGRTLIFNVGTQHISSVPAEGDRTPAKVLEASFNQVQGKLSPDGRWIAYTSNENNRTDVFVQTFPPGGGKWQISIDGGGEPAWRADGRELFFMNGRRLYAVDVEATGGRFEAGTPRELFEASVLTGEVRRNRYVVSADGQRFLLVTSPPAADSTPMTVVLNWPAALPQ
jgi:Tol biopolymer transport system component